MEAASHLAHFSVQGSEHAGLLEFEPKPNIEIYADADLHLDEAEMECVRGTSKDGARISAIKCVGSGKPGTHFYHDRRRHFLKLFPNFVVMGPRYLEPLEAAITSLVFTFPGANDLFYDWGTFGSIFRPQMLSFAQKREILRHVKSDPKHRRRGGRLELYYHWDRGPIVEVQAELGKVRAWNAPTVHSPSPSGLFIANKVRITIEFAEPVNFETALKATYDMMPFFELASESRQVIEDIRITHKDGGKEAPLAVYISNLDRRPVERSGAIDALVCAGRQPEEFGSTWRGWLDSMRDRGAARHRFMQGFRNGSRYDVDRLIGAANAFDLLPRTDFLPSKMPEEAETLLTELETQVKKSASEPAMQDYRQRLLASLAQMRGLSLREKVLQRYASLPGDVKQRLPGMEEIIAHGIRARNFFVHGSRTKFEKDDLFRLASFFTDTLEFVFAASEFQLCGWRASRWVTESFTHSPFKWYLRNFEQHAKEVKKAAEGASVS